MRIEKETEVTIKVKIGWVWPDDFQDKFHISEESFRNEFTVDDDHARELIMVLWEKSSDLLQASEVTIQDLGIVQE